MQKNIRKLFGILKNFYSLHYLFFGLCHHGQHVISAFGDFNELALECGEFIDKIKIF